jgi:GNAT superfamily N-acetyltransferase
MPDVRLLTAEPADAERLAELMARTFRETYSSEHSGASRPADVEAYVAAHFGAARQRAELVDPAMRTILAETDGALAGYAQLRFGAPAPVGGGRRPVELARFYVDRPWHGRGVAAALMSACIAAAGAADPLWLGVFERNDRARAFYAKWGFVPIGRTTFRMGEDLQHDWVLALDPSSNDR